MNGWLWAAVVVLVVVAAVVWVGCHHRGRVAKNVGMLAPTSSEDLVSEDRIIFGGMPRAKSENGGGVGDFVMLQNMAYVVGYSEGRKVPLFACYRVISEQPFKLDRPKGNFKTDRRTLSQVKHADYTGSGYDRGHMVPNSAIAKCFGAEAQLETFLLTNICPQAPSLNQRVWEELERKELVYAVRFGEVWVMDGPVFADTTGGTTYQLRTGIAVPSAFWKILLEDEGGGRNGEDRVRVFSVVMPQTVVGTEKPGQFTAAIDRIEKETGLEFLWKLSPAKQRSLKNAAWREW